MRLRITKNVMVACEPFSLRVTIVSSATSFFINLVLNYPEKSNTHFIVIHSPSSQSHLIGPSGFFVMLVTNLAITLPIIVRNALLMSMFNVV